MEESRSKNRYYKYNDGWFTYYVGIDTHDKKFELDPETDIEVEANLDEFMMEQSWLE